MALPAKVSLRQPPVKPGYGHKPSVRWSANSRRSSIDLRSLGKALPLLTHRLEGDLPRAERTHTTHTASSGKPSFLSLLFYVGE